MGCLARPVSDLCLVSDRVRLARAFTAGRVRLSFFRFGHFFGFELDFLD
jgi:hypothetical protein